MNSFNEIAQNFEQYLNEQNIFPKLPQGLYAPCKYILEAGGKRVRPALAIMAYEMYGGKGNDAYYAAAAFELFHNFTLIHDDIMDNAPLRRGRKTVHEAYGMTAGILSGDVMCIYAYAQLAKVKPQYLHELILLFNQTAIEVCEGQQYDMDFEQLDHVTVEDYLNMITLKTSVLLAASLKAGALLANAPKEEQEKIYLFGKNLGLAFQLQDDYLDTFGEDGKTGKQIGGDIKANKKTILWVQVMNQGTAEQKALLNELKSYQEEDKVNQVMQIYEASGVRQSSRNLIQSYTDKAFATLDAIALPNAQKKPLIDLASYLLNRDF